MAKTETKILERTYNVPLRKEFLKAPSWNRTKKAVSALKQFLAKHMKSSDVRLSNNVNLELWKQGIRNPPHHVKITVTKDEKGVVKAELFGVKKEETKLEQKVEETKNKERAKSEAKEDQKESV